MDNGYRINELEPAGISRDDGKRPDGLSLVPWERGRALMWDTLASIHIRETESKPGAAAETAESDKRHRSSSSLVGCLDNVRSEKKMDIRGSIPESDDQFAVAESRCDNLKEKIDLVKSLRRKKKLKKRSMTTIAEPSSMNETMADMFPFISVSTQPKKKVSQQAARMRRIEMPQNANPMRGYLDPALIEQHHMLDRVNAHNIHHNAHKSTRQDKTKPSRVIPDSATLLRTHPRRSQANGDMCEQGVQITSRNMPQEVACGDDELSDRTEEDVFLYANDVYADPKLNSRKQGESRQQSKLSPGVRRRHVPKDHVIDEGKRMQETGYRPVVELFNNKNRPNPEPWPQQVNNNTTTRATKNRKAYPPSCHDDTMKTIPSEDLVQKPRKKANRRVKYQSRRYEMPTVSSQMKQAGARCYYEAPNQTNIPFVISKSTAPSHNVGVNIQQVLNGIKMQQPLSGIPLTIAHHMGLRHVPTFGAKNPTQRPELHKSEINVIKLGRRTVRLPSYKCMSYNRLLALYREGEGIVPRFLRAVSRPHYFYTSMYNLTTNREDFDGATSKGRAGSQEAKQNLAEYANLYREYERIEKALNEKYDPELEMRKEELAIQLTAREGFIRKVVQEYKPESEADPVLRASASTAENAYRRSTFKLNSDEPN